MERAPSSSGRHWLWIFDAFRSRWGWTECRNYYLWKNSQALAALTHTVVLKAKEVLSLHRNIWGFHVSREVGHEIHSLQKERGWKILGRLLKQEERLKKHLSLCCNTAVLEWHGIGNNSPKRWQSWGPTAVLEKFAFWTLSNLNTKRVCGKCDRSINVCISPAYQCAMRSEKLCSVGWGESSSFIKHLSSGQLHYHNTELLYHETNILPQKDSLVDRLGYCASCASFVCVRRLDFKKVKGKEYSRQRKYGSIPIKK